MPSERSFFHYYCVGSNVCILKGLTILLVTTYTCSMTLERPHNIAGYYHIALAAYLKGPLHVREFVAEDED